MNILDVDESDQGQESGAYAQLYELSVAPESTAQATALFGKTLLSAEDRHVCFLVHSRC